MRSIVDASFIFTARWYCVSSSATIFLSSASDASDLFCFAVPIAPVFPFVCAAVLQMPPSKQKTVRNVEMIFILFPTNFLNLSAQSLRARFGDLRVLRRLNARHAYT